MKFFAPAKVNLFLHIVGKRDDGYHDIESIMTFTDIADEIKIEKSDDFSLNVIGFFNKDLSGHCRTTDNIITKTVQIMSKTFDFEGNFSVTLRKDLPPAAGIGGGSADSAAVVYGLNKMMGIALDDPRLDDVLLSLGADVPACYRSVTSFVTGIGQHVEPMEEFLEPACALLVNPRISVSTQKVYGMLHAPYTKSLLKNDIIHPRDEGFWDFIRAQRNDMQDAAIALAPEISSVLKVMDAQPGCILSRMSGSGATCFGVFESQVDVDAAMIAFKKIAPKYWVQPVALGTPKIF